MSTARVLLLHSSSGHYGADRQLGLIARGLDRARFEPLVVLPSEGPLAEDLRAGGVETIVRPLAVLRRSLLDARGAAAVSAAASRDAAVLARLIRVRGIGLVHSNTSVVLGGAAAAALTRRPHVWHVREIYGRFPVAWRPYRRLLRSAQALVCVSEATAEQFRRREGRRDPRVRVIHDGLAVDPSPTARDAARAVLGLPPDVPVVAVLGRISDWKGQDVLVRALAEPPLAARGTIGVLAGEVWPGAEERLERVLNLARNLRVEDRLRLVGFHEPALIYGAAEVIVVPSTAPDPLPNTAIEAASAGCAVVASRHGGLPEIIRDGRTGVLVTPGDPTALADTLAALIDDPGRRARLGAAAAADARERFAAARMLAALEQLYDELLSR